MAEGRAEKTVGKLDHDRDKYSDPKKALKWIFGHEQFPDTPVDKVEVFFLSNGDFTYRVWGAKEEDYASGAYDAQSRGQLQ